MRPLWKRWLDPDPPADEVLGINRRNLDLVFADYRPGRFRELDDKLAAKTALARAGLPVPATLGVVENGTRDELAGLLAGLEAVVIKPAKGWGGRGILVLERRAATWFGPDGEPVSDDEVRDHVADILTGIHSLDEETDRVVLEEMLRPHPFYAGLAPTGLCDLRIVVENGAAVQAMVRVPTAASGGKANLHGGGMGLGVDLDSGMITSAIVGDRPTDRHPDTGEVVIGRQLPDWRACLDLATAAAAAVEVDYVGVDIVVEARRGPLVLEINARPGLAIQLANVQGQPVRTRTVLARTDRLTNTFNWLLMALLAASPLVFHWWQSENTNTLVVDIGEDVARGAVHYQERDETVGPTAAAAEAQFEEMDLAARSAVFASARSAATAGDTATALALYRSTLADSALAPFALNNLAVLARRSGHDSLAIAHLTEAVDRFPAYTRGYYNLGLVLRAADQQVAAEAAFRRVLALKPNHDRAWMAVGRLLFNRGDHTEAAAAFGQAIRFDPASRDARLRRGLALRLAGDPAGARGNFEELLALAPNHEAAAYWLARTGREQVLAAGAVSDSLLVWRQVLSPFERTSPRCLSLSAVLAAEAGDAAVAISLFERRELKRYRPGFHRLALAATALRVGLWKRAAQAADDAVRSRPGEARRLRLLAELGASLTDPESAPVTTAVTDDPFLRLAAAAAAEERRLAWTLLDALADDAWPRWLAAPDPDAAPSLQVPADLRPFALTSPSLDDWIDPAAAPPLEIQLYLGLVLAERRGDAETAAASREALSRRSPDFLPLRRAALERAVAADSLAVAGRIGDRILELGVDDPLLTLEIAEIHCRRGATRRARGLLGRLPAAQQETPTALALAGRIAVTEGRPGDAIRFLDEALQKDPANVDALLAQGRAYRALDRLRQAEDVLGRARDLAPGRVDVRRDLAMVLLKRRDYPAAAAAWLEVLVLAPDDLPARFNRALALQRSGDEAGALAAYDELLTRDPDRPSAVFNRGLALERSGRIADAIEAYRHMLELDPDHEASREKLTQLQGREP